MSLLVLIDGGYLKAVGKLQGKRADLAKLPLWVLEQVQRHNHGQPATLLRTVYYDCPPYQSTPPTPEEKQRTKSFDSFRRYLENLPKFEVRLGRLVKRYDGKGQPFFEQKRVDVLLATDLLYYAFLGRVTDIALVAGDADFIPAVQRAHDAGVRIWLVHGPGAARDLYRLVDGRIPLLDEHGAVRYPTL